VVLFGRSFPAFSCCCPLCYFPCSTLPLLNSESRHPRFEWQSGSVGEHGKTVAGQILVDQRIVPVGDENLDVCVLRVSMWYAPIAFITGQTGKNVKALLNHSQMLFKQARSRVATSDLNRLLKAAMEQNQPPLYRSRRPKIYYATQVGTEPPTIVLFCNEPKAISPTYQRYLLGVFRDHLTFSEVPIKLYIRRRDSRQDFFEHLSPDDAEEAPANPGLGL
jgi:hypothetical protein